MDLYNVAEIELSYRSIGKTTERPVIKGCESAYNIFRANWDDGKLDFIEQAKIMLLNRANRVMGISNVSTGGVAGTIVDPRLVFVTALKANASSIILAHNHPSANLKPSTEDKKLTQRLTDAGKLLEIMVLDHLIVTREGYYSFAEDLAYEKVHRGDMYWFEAAPPF